jgi:hypothetical protein
MKKLTNEGCPKDMSPKIKEFMKNKGLRDIAENFLSTQQKLAEKYGAEISISCGDKEVAITKPSRRLHKEIKEEDL